MRLILCTGKTRFAVRDILAELGLKSPSINLNGLIAFDEEDRVRSTCAFISTLLVNNASPSPQRNVLSKKNTRLPAVVFDFFLNLITVLV